jgi:hypothetical protein
MAKLFRSGFASFAGNFLDFLMRHGSKSLSRAARALMIFSLSVFIGSLM